MQEGSEGKSDLTPRAAGRRYSGRVNKGTFGNRLGVESFAK